MTNQRLGSTLLSVALIFVLLLVSTVSLATAQNPQQLYPGGDEGEITEIIIDETGLFTETASKYGVTYIISGIPRSIGTVTTIAYNGNPRPTAQIPVGAILTKFFVVTFDFKSEDFLQATLIFSYTDADVEGLQRISVYKHVPEIDSYVQFVSLVDTDAKTITITLDSPNDPLFAIGGLPITNPPNNTAIMWVFIALVIVVIVIVTFLVVKRYSP